jgi:hypothetical protein
MTSRHADDLRPEQPDHRLPLLALDMLEKKPYNSLNLGLTVSLASQSPHFWGSITPY